MSDLVCDLVIPAYNERENIDALFDAIDSIRPRIAPAVIRHCVIGDNNSTDGTGEAARSRDAVVVHEAQRGYGSACLRALAWIAEQNAPPDVVVFLDADLSDDPAALPALLQPLAEDRADIVIGSRVKRAEPGALNVVQRFGNGLACTMMHLLGGVRYGDLGPFRAVRWSTLQQLQMSDRTWGWTVEMQMKAALLSMRIVEVDVPYRRRRAGKSKISGTIRGVVTAGTKIITTILSLWWQRGRIRRAVAANTMS
ncbi:MAG: glycosyltransferase family 2 protein [Phycisphaerales bacterium]|nr:glycosyltransferase family 2 protein [Phycisphaerales bacterium]